MRLKKSDANHPTFEEFVKGVNKEHIMYNVKTRHLLAYVSAAALISSNAMAATQSVTANIAFDTVLSIAKEHDIDFGTVKAAQSGTYVINTAGTVTPSGGGVWVSGSPTSGELTVSGSSTQTVSVSVGSYVANGGVTPSAATCKWGGAAVDADCTFSGGAAPGAGTTLLVGVQVDADGTQNAGDTAAPTFVVTVVYG